MRWSRLVGVSPVLLLLQGCGDKHEGFCKDNGGITKTCRYAKIAASDRVGRALKAKGMKKIKETEYADAVRLRTKCLGTHGSLDKAAEDQELVKACVECKPFDIVDDSDDKASKFLPLMSCMVGEFAKDAGKKMKEETDTSSEHGYLNRADNQADLKNRQKDTKRALETAIQWVGKVANGGWVCDAPTDNAREVSLCASKLTFQTEPAAEDCEIEYGSPKENGKPQPCGRAGRKTTKSCLKCTPKKWSDDNTEASYMKKVVVHGHIGKGGLCRQFPKIEKAVVEEFFDTAWSKAAGSCDVAKAPECEQKIDAALKASEFRLNTLNHKAGTDEGESGLELPADNTDALLETGAMEVAADGSAAQSEAEGRSPRVVFQDLLSDETGQTAQVTSDFWDIGAARIADSEPAAVLD